MQDKPGTNLLILYTRQRITTPLVAIAGTAAAGVGAIAALQLGGPLPVLNVLAGAGAAIFVVARLLSFAATALAIGPEAIELRSGSRRRRIPWSDIVKVEQVRGYLDPNPVARNPKFSLQDGIKLTLRNEPAAFIPDRFDIRQDRLFAEISERLSHAQEHDVWIRGGMQPSN